MDPDISISVRHWPFQSLSDISSDDIFCCPLTIGDCPPSDVPLFSAVVDEIIRHILAGEKDAWKAFFLLPRLVFALPRGGRHCKRLVQVYLSQFNAGQWSSLLLRRVQHIGDSKGSYNHQKHALSLARVGCFGAAARALTSGKIADSSLDDVYEQIVQLHPAASR